MGDATVLLVEADRESRERLGSWLKEAGFEVLACPGPSVCDGCVGTRGGTCPLVEGAEVVVLDPWLAGAEVMDGTSADELVAYYVERTERVLVLGSKPRPLDPFAGEVEWLGPRADRELLVGAVRAAVEGLSEPSGIRDEVALRARTGSMRRCSTAT